MSHPVISAWQINITRHWNLNLSGKPVLVSYRPSDSTKANQSSFLKSTKIKIYPQIPTDVRKHYKPLGCGVELWGDNTRE